MNKKEYCLTHPATAYYSGFNGLEIHGIEYGINDYIMCRSGAWNGKPNYHRLKVYYTNNGEYIKLHGYRIPLNECIRIGE